MDVTDAVPRGWLKDFGYYAIWFAVWGGLLSAFQPVTAEQMEGIGFWSVKVQQMLVGVFFGLICTMGFTLVQNGINQARRRCLSWFLAIGTWIVMSLLLPRAIETFG
jgi:hypothetical protein